MSSGTLLCGNLRKVGGAGHAQLQTRFFILDTTGTLSYYEATAAVAQRLLATGGRAVSATAPPPAELGKAKGALSVKGAYVLDRGSLFGHAGCFSLIGAEHAGGDKKGKEYFLFAAADETGGAAAAAAARDRWLWVTALMAVSGRYGFLFDALATQSSAEGTVAATKRRLALSPLCDVCELLKESSTLGNDKCADCDALHPTWCVVRPFGVFVCIDCIGVHRGLWAGRCREVQLDHWPQEDIAYMAARGGNAHVNGSELEAAGRADAVPNVQATAAVRTPPKPRADSLPTVRRAFIEAKYGDARVFQTQPFMLDDSVAAPQPPPSATASLSSLEPVDGLARAAAYVRGLVTDTSLAPPRFQGVALIEGPIHMRRILPTAPKLSAAAWRNSYVVLGSGLPGMIAKSVPTGGPSSTEGPVMWPSPILSLSLDTAQRPICLTVFDESGTFALFTGEVVLPPAGIGAAEAVEVIVPSIEPLGGGSPSCGYAVLLNARFEQLV